MICRYAVLAAVLLACTAGAAETRYDFGGRISAEGVAATYPDNSVFDEFIGSPAYDANGIARAILKVDRGGWDFRADYQNAILWGDTVSGGRALPPGIGGGSNRRIPNDDRRLFDLTDTIKEGEDYVWLHRLDRLSIGHTTEKTVVRFGRQAITWGNGLVYNPVDIFNPFDPAAVDKEYKAGDDLLYGQYLTNSGDDLQAVVVFRRDLDTGNLDKDSSAAAIKYHGFLGSNEYDLLAAQNYGDTLLSVGGNISVGGAVWRADVVSTIADNDTVWQFVGSYSESWVWWGKNVSGVLEYFYNGFGQRAGKYSPDEFSSNPDLVARLARGELFTLGRHYVAASASIEVNPLFLVIPNLFVNVGDPSALVQVVTQNNLGDNLLLLGSINVPVGPPGSEFGGPDAGIPGLYLSAGPSVSLQLNWYF